MRLKGILSVWSVCGVLFAILLFAPLQSMAVSWGYPPGSQQAECLANRINPPEIYPDRDSAYEAMMADIRSSLEKCKARQDLTEEERQRFCNSLPWAESRCTSYCSPPCTTSPPYPCWLSITGCYVPDCMFGCEGCKGETTMVNGAWPWHYYWYPRCGAPPPTQQPDPPIPTEEPRREQGTFGCATN